MFKEKVLSEKRSNVEPALARDVMSYFLRNPYAADTLDGVTRWRLLEQQLHRTVKEVEKALDFLVTHGFLTKVSQLGSTPIFHLSEDKTEDARTCLEITEDEE